MAVDILWVGYPKSYTKGRARKIQFVTVHYTAGSEGPKSAEAGAAYDKRRTDGTSTHYFVDSEGPALQEVPDGDRAHTARKHGNEIGIHIEICGTRQTRAQWLDNTSLATLKTAAALVRHLCDKHNLAIRRLTTSQTRAAYYAEGVKPTGINDHAACTLAFPEDHGDHLDVGSEFPWDIFLELVHAGGDMAGTGIIGLKLGDQGESVKALQESLSRAGYNPGPIDGKYGQQTSDALLQCRKDMGSSATSGDTVTGAAYAQLHSALAKAQAGGGEQGPPGVPGPPGPPGPPGEINTGSKVTIEGGTIIAVQS